MSNYNIAISSINTAISDLSNAKSKINEVALVDNVSSLTQLETSIEESIETLNRIKDDMIANKSVIDNCMDNLGMR